MTKKRKKFARQRRVRKNRSLKTKIKALPPLLERRLKPKEQTIQKKQQFTLTEEDRLTYIYERSIDGKILKVVDVSYELKINGDWVTVIRYDSEHGHLHRHSWLKKTRDEFVSIIGVKKKGTPHDWLTWAIRDVVSRYPSYKKGFLKQRRNLTRLG